jgi:HD-GYP domain-containing protein (c-di-GMP phosphodiesterase class II)
MLARLCEAIDARPYMQGHGARVGELSEAVGIRMGWGADRLRRLRIGARLHDIGKLAVPSEVWQKPGPLTPAELAHVRRHPAAGVQLLAGMNELRFAVPCVLFHHERWDGCGYPSRKRGNEIPLEARVLAITDAYDAMTSPRPYGPPLDHDAAVEELARCAGTQFDPTVAAVFLDLLRGRTRLRASSASA